MPEQSDPNYMLSLERGMSVLEAFSAGGGALSIAGVARATGMSPAAARRCLHTLGILGYVSQAEKGFQLSPKILTLGQRYSGPASLAQAAQPVLERLTERLRESTAAVVLDGDEIVFVASATAKRIVSVEMSVGNRLPAYPTSLGRVLIASSEPARISEYFSKVKLVKHTSYTVVNRKTLMHDLAQVRASGYALVDQEFAIGARSLAVPVRGRDGTTVAAINVATHTARHEPDAMIREMLPLLKAAAQEISAALGPQSG